MSAISGLGSSSSYASYGGNGGVDPAKMKEKMFAAMDANGDGDVSKTELQSLLDKMSAASGTSSTVSVDDIMNSVDTDGDGSLSKSEFAASGPKPKDSYGSDNLSAQMSTAQFAHMAGAGGPPPGPPPSGDLSSLDEDDDGSISSTEFGISSSSDTKLTELFKAIDTDGSGSLSSEETDAFKAAMEAMRPPEPPPQQTQQSSATLDALLQRYAQYAQATNDSSSASSQLSLVA